METVLITGAKGFIGRNIQKKLAQEYKTIGCDLSEKENDEEYIHWDISRDSEPFVELGNVDYIVHAAASLDMNSLSEELIRVNCMGTLKVLQYAIKKQTKCVVYLSSLPVVGETHAVPISEESALNPGTLYHVSKAAGEMIINLGKSYGIRIVCLRVPSPIGPDMRQNTIVPVFIKNAINGIPIEIKGKGTRRQSFIDVRDVANAIAKVLKNESCCGTYNIGSKNIATNYELAKLCNKLLRNNNSIIFQGKDVNDDVDWTTDDTKLLKAIGEYQIHSLSESIIEIAEEIKKHENPIF